MKFKKNVVGRSIGGWGGGGGSGAGWVGVRVDVIEEFKFL